MTYQQDYSYFNPTQKELDEAKAGIEQFAPKPNTRKRDGKTATAYISFDWLELLLVQFIRSDKKRREAKTILQHRMAQEANKARIGELEKTLIALAWMYDQYCGDNFGHNFMGAGEDAIEILENHGLGDERKGIDHTALTELERLINAGKLDNSNPPAQKLDKSVQNKTKRKD